MMQFTALRAKLTSVGRVFFIARQRNNALAICFEANATAGSTIEAGAIYSLVHFVSNLYRLAQAQKDLSTFDFNGVTGDAA